MFNSLVAEKNAAESLGISLSTLQRLRKSGKGPACVKLNQKRYAYLADDIKCWIDERRRESIANELLPLEAYEDDQAGYPI